MVEPHPDREGYWQFTGPQRLDKAVHTLGGVLNTIGIGGVTADEIASLSNWIAEHRRMAHRHPFNEILPRLTTAITDGVLDSDELDDLRWLCDRLHSEHGFYDAITSEMQVLQGMLGGIVADGRVSDAEVDALRAWMDEHEALRYCWPYDEIDALITSVRQDGKIDDHERRQLLAFFSEWTTIRGNRALSIPLNEAKIAITGICAVCPEVTFPDRTFCFTGASPKVTRKDFQRIVEERRGTFSPRVTKSIDYLVIGGEENPCWAYACYGRKVEQAVTLRREGCQLLLVHENDFWDAIA